MNRLKELRKEKGIGQSTLGIGIGVSERTISRWENDETQIKAEKAQELADYFGVSVGYLLGYEHQEGTATEAQLVLGKMLVDIFEELEDNKFLGGQVQDVTVNGHEYTVTVTKTGARK